MVKLWSDLLSQILSTRLILKKAHNLFDSHVKKKKSPISSSQSLNNITRLTYFIDQDYFSKCHLEGQLCSSRVVGTESFQLVQSGPNPNHWCCSQYPVVKTEKSVCKLNEQDPIPAAISMICLKIDLSQMGSLIVIWSVKP